MVDSLVPQPMKFQLSDSIICLGDSTYLTLNNIFNVSIKPTSDYLVVDSSHYTFVPANTATYTIYGQTVVCGPVDSQVITIHVIAPEVQVSISGDTLSAFNAVAYQWYFNDSLISGATSSTYIAALHGTYSVQVTDTNGCIANSNPITVTGINEIDANSVQVYPNPLANGNWQLTVFNNLLGAEARIYDDNAQLVEKLIINNLRTEITAPLAGGVYYLRINTAQGSINRKLVKL